MSSPCTSWLFSIQRTRVYRLFALATFSVLTVLAMSGTAHALFVQVNSARIVDDEVELVVSTDVDHSCFLMRTTTNQVRNQFAMCLTAGQQQPFTAPLSWFPNLQINDTLVLETIIAPVVTSASFRFTGDLSLTSVRVVGGTQVEVTYSMRFPACAVMTDASGNIISRTSTAFCTSGENITVLLDRELHFTSVQPGQSVRLTPLLRQDLVTNTVAVNSVASPLPCVLSEGGLTLGDRAGIVSAKVYSGADISLGSDAAITGNVFGRDDLDMNWRSKISGDVNLIGTLGLDRGSITGDLNENMPVTQQLLEESVVFESTPNYTVQPDQGLTLPAGRYGNVVVLDRGRLRLSSAGAYSFNRLSFANDSKLELNTSSGDFNVEAETLQIGQRFVMLPVGGGSVDGSRVFFYNNSTTLNIGADSVVRGQVWSPNAALQVQDRAKVQGCVRASSILVGADARILQN